MVKILEKLKSLFKTTATEKQEAKVHQEEPKTEEIPEKHGQ